jgi:hypothetical protein
MKRTFWITGALLCASLGVAACGGSRKEAAPAQTPASEQPAYGAPPQEEGGAAKQEAPASDRSSGEAAPAAPSGALLPGSIRTRGPGDEPQDEIEGLTRRLEGALSLATPDCTSAWSLRDRICDLADRICDLAGRSAERDVAERCSDGRTRCQRATSRVRETCGR